MLIGYALVRQLEGDLEPSRCVAEDLTRTLVDLAYLRNVTMAEAEYF
jgi:hypothetical protein